MNEKEYMLLIQNLQIQNKNLTQQNEKLRRQLAENQDYEQLYSNIVTAIKGEGEGSLDSPEEIKKLKKKNKRLQRELEQKNSHIEDLERELHKSKKILDEKEQEISALTLEQEQCIKNLEGIHSKIQSNSTLYLEIKKVLQENMDLKSQLEKLNLHKETQSQADSLRQSFYQDSNIYGNQRNIQKDISFQPKHL